MLNFIGLNDTKIDMQNILLMEYIEFIKHFNQCVFLFKLATLSWWLNLHFSYCTIQSSVDVCLYT